MFSVRWIAFGVACWFVCLISWKPHPCPLASVVSFSACAMYWPFPGSCVVCSTKWGGFGLYSLLLFKPATRIPGTLHLCNHTVDRNTKGNPGGFNLVQTGLGENQVLSFLLSDRHSLLSGNAPSLLPDSHWLEDRLITPSPCCSAFLQVLQEWLHSFVFPEQVDRQVVVISKSQMQHVVRYRIRWHTER